MLSRPPPSEITASMALRSAAEMALLHANERELSDEFAIARQLKIELDDDLCRHRIVPPRALCRLGNSTLSNKACIVGIIKGVCSMRFFIIVIAMSLSTLASGSTAIAQQEQPAPALPTADQNAAEKLNPSWYREDAPYRPCPAVAAINGRNVCVGCPGRCPWPPRFGR